HYSYYNRKQIHKLAINNNIVYKLNTLYGFVSVITLPVIPLDITIGNSSAFSYYSLGSQIFVHPKSYYKKVSTNMEILTKYGLISIEVRISSKKNIDYDLDLARSGSGIFYKNYIEHKLHILESKLKNQYISKYKTISAMKKEVAKNKTYVEKLILSTNKEKVNTSASKHNVSFTILYKSKIGNKYYIRYMISNSTNSYIMLHDIYLYDNSSSWYGASSKKEIRIFNPISNLKLMPREVYKGYIVYNNKKANDVSVHLYLNGKLNIIKVQL
ncbi:MAG: hypothetical protein ACYCTB_11115, partial [bacterium]